MPSPGPLLGCTVESISLAVSGAFLGEETGGKGTAALPRGHPAKEIY